MIFTLINFAVSFSEIFIEANRTNTVRPIVSICWLLLSRDSKHGEHETFESSKLKFCLFNKLEILENLKILKS